MHETELVSKLFDYIEEEMEGKTWEVTDIEDIFRCGMVMGKYRTLCELLGIDPDSYAKTNNLVLVDM